MCTECEAHNVCTIHSLRTKAGTISLIKNVTQNMPREYNVMREMELNLSYHPPNGVESSCERSMMPGGHGTARGEKQQHTNTVYSKIKLQI